MADVNTAEVEAKVDAAFGAGFGDTPPAPAVKVVDESKPAATPAPVVPAKPPPQYVRLTKEEWDNTKAAAGKVSSLESRVAKFEGSIPKAEQIIQQVTEKVQAQTPAGTQIDPQVLIDAFAEQEKDFPELAAQNRKAFEYILKNLRGTAPASSPAPSVEVKKLVDELLLEREDKALQRAYPTWRDIVGAVDVSAGDEIPKDNPFRKWAETLPAGEQKELNETKSPAVVQAFIDRFQSAQAIKPVPATPKPDKAAARRAVIEDAVTPRADGNPPPLNPSQTAEDAFLAAGKAYRARKV